MKTDRQTERDRQTDRQTRQDRERDRERQTVRQTDRLTRWIIPAECTYYNSVQTYRDIHHIENIHM